MKKENIILNQQEVDHKIKRIAYQIYETNVDESELIIAGIYENGYTFAKRLENELSSISDLKVELCKIEMDKKNPLNTIKIDIPLEAFSNKSVVIADDVLNTGTTLMYAVQHLLNVPLKRLKTTVLVNRNHKKFPVKADFKGVSLSTSLNNTIEVTFGKEDSVTLK